MKRTLIFLACHLIIGIVQSQTISNIINQEFRNLEMNHQLSQLEDSFATQINSLEKCLKIGEFLFISGGRLDPILKRTKQIAQKHFEMNQGLILTWGANGDCGRWGEWYDTLTIKYGFRYASVDCSCLDSNAPEIAKAYNSYALPALLVKNGKNWDKKLEKEILARKRNIQLYLESLEKDQFDEIHISLKELKKYPQEIERLTHLKRLYFNVNHLSKVNNGICNLDQLEVLSFYSNDFKVFPDEIICLKKLEVLNFDKNKLKKIPPNINLLQNLKRFHLSNNKLKKLPVEFSGLSKLIWLDLRENRLIALPDNFHKLENLTTLLLWENKLSSVPKSLYKMKHLETLFISYGNNIPESEIEALKQALPNTEIK